MDPDCVAGTRGSTTDADCDGTVKARASKHRSSPVAKAAAKTVGSALLLEDGITLLMHRRIPPM